MKSVDFRLVSGKRGGCEVTCEASGSVGRVHSHQPWGSSHRLPHFASVSLKGRAFVFFFFVCQPFALSFSVLYSFLKYAVGGLSLWWTQESFPIFHPKVPSLPNRNQVSLVVTFLVLSLVASGKWWFRECHEIKRIWWSPPPSSKLLLYTGRTRDKGGRWRRDWGKRSNWDWVVQTKEGLGM